MYGSRTTSPALPDLESALRRAEAAWYAAYMAAEQAGTDLPS
jgi:hypothetical protein